MRTRLRERRRERGDTCRRTAPSRSRLGAEANRHDRWATTHLLELCRGLTDAQLDQQFDIGHRTLRATIDHQIPNLDFETGLMTGQLVAPRRPHTVD